MSNGNKHESEDVGGGLEFEEAIAARAAGLPTTDKLSADDKELLDAIGPWLPILKDALATSQEDATRDAPRLATIDVDDPVASMLGLVPNRDMILDGRKLATARQAAKINLGQLVQRLVSRGWAATNAAAFAWEQGRQNPAPAVINAIADELGLAPESLLASTNTVEPLAELFNDERIAEFIEDWAQETGISADTLQDKSRRMLASAGRRNNTTASVDTLLVILGHLRRLAKFGMTP